MTDQHGDALAAYRAPAEYVDSDHPQIVATADRLSRGAADRREIAVAVYHFARDLTYEADDFEDLEIFRASHVLAAGHGYCVSKASLCTALARASGIPARLGFADVRNHLASPRLLRAFGTDTFFWHGFTEMHLGGRWVRVSPTFDPITCERAGVPLLAFDGEHDALLQAFDGGGHMEYGTAHGSFHDVPARFLAAEMHRRYSFTRDRGITLYKAGGPPS